MIAFMESLMAIPEAERVVEPTISMIVVTSDGHMVSGGDYLGNFIDLEQNVHAMFKHFGLDAADAAELLTNIIDYRGIPTYSEAI